jgi:hypothetical protein
LQAVTTRDRGWAGPQHVARSRSRSAGRPALQIVLPLVFTPLVVVVLLQMSLLCAGRRERLPLAAPTTTTSEVRPNVVVVLPATVAPDRPVSSASGPAVPRPVGC